MKTRYFLGLPFAEIGISGSEVEALVDTGFNGAGKRNTLNWAF